RSMNHAYEQCGVRLPATRLATGEEAKPLRGTGLVLAPPSTTATTWLRKLAGPDGISTAFVSGWMRVRGGRRRQHVDRGFVLSAPADWPALLRTINDTGAGRIGVTHGYAQAMSRWLTEQGRDAFVVPSRYEGELGETPSAGASQADGQPDPGL